MSRTYGWRRCWVLGLTLGCVAWLPARAELVIKSFGATGQLVFQTLADGTNYNYRVEWAPAVTGPWSTFTGAGSWLDTIVAAQGGSVTSTVPMCYRVVAWPGDYLVVDLSGGTTAKSYPVSYYRTLADVPGGANSDAYKTTNLLLRLIPKGTFTMGSPTNEGFSVEAQHVVTLSRDFYIGVFQVTQQQWAQVMSNWPSYFTNASYSATRPVERVSYNDIRGASAGASWPTNNNVDETSFMGVLRARTGLTFDLPTESQWEYACRAGTTTALNSGCNLIYPWVWEDPNMDAVGRYFYWGTYDEDAVEQNADTSRGTAKVGSYQPNAWGLYDMHGNVWECCLDWYNAAYPLGPVTDPRGATSGTLRAFRGGTWYDFAEYERSASRGGMTPDGSNWIAGFRALLLPSGR